MSVLRKTWYRVESLIAWVLAVVIVVAILAGVYYLVVVL